MKNEKLDSIEKKMDRVLELLENKKMSNLSKNDFDTIQVGQLTDDQMRRFHLGLYSKISTPGSDSV